MNENRFPSYVELRRKGTFVPIEKATPEQIRYDAEELASGARRRGLLDYLKARPHRNDQAKTIRVVVESENREPITVGVKLLPQDQPEMIVVPVKERTR